MGSSTILNKMISPTGFSPNTELLIDGRINTIASLVIRVGTADSFSLDDDLSVKESYLFHIQARFYNAAHHLKFTNGLDIECLPTSLFLSANGWREARELQVGDAMIAGKVGVTRVTGAPIKVAVSEPKVVLVDRPFYHFNARFTGINGRMSHNTILPAYSEREEEITFIITHQ